MIDEYILSLCDKYKIDRTKDYTVEELSAKIDFFLDNLELENKKVRDAFMPEFRYLCRMYREKTQNQQKK